MTIKEITVEFYKGYYFSKNLISNQGDPCIRYAELFEENTLYFENCKLFTNKAKIKNPKYCEYGDILIATTSNIKKNIAKACAYLGKEKALIDSECMVIKHNQNPKYLAFLLSTHQFRKNIKLSALSCIFHITFNSIKEIKIPIPSLKKQQKIVDLLDKFWILLNNIKEGLPAEILLRKQQYEYYRNKLII